MNLLRLIVLFLFLISMLPSFATASQETVFETTSVSTTIQDNGTHQAHNAILPIRDYVPQKVRSRIISHFYTSENISQPFISTLLGQAVFRTNRVWCFACKPPLFLLYHLFLFYDSTYHVSTL